MGDPAAREVHGVRVRIFKSILAFAFALLIAVSPILAQLPTGTILGVVKDSTGGTVPDAQVTLTNTETNSVRSVTTGSEGEYRVPALQPGHYSVKVEKSGFKTTTQTGVLLDVAAEIVVNAALEIGSSTQQVTVTGEAPLVETTTSSLGGLVNDAKVADLPLNGRNFVDLALLQPGVTNDTNLGNTNAQNGNWGVMFSSNGSPVRSNNFTLDGAPMINIHGNTAGGIGTTLGVDGIKEYKVITDAFNAEYGLGMGSQVVIVSKGGTNQFHGDVFEYLRNSSMDARNFFDYTYVTTGKRIPELQRNNFGGSFGGPIKKDKTFVYGVFEALRQNFGATIVDTVPSEPSAAFPNIMNCHLATNNPCATSSAAATATTAAVPVGTVAPSMISFLALFPAPNLPLSQFTFPYVQPSSVNYGQVRIDHNFSVKDSVFGRYTIQDANNTNAASYPQFQILSIGRDQFVTLSENHIFSSTLLNTVRASLSRTNVGEFPQFPSFLNGPQYSYVTGQAMGTLAATGLTTIGPTSNAPYRLLQNIYTASDDVYYTKGKHAFKFGMLFNRFENYDIVSISTRGTLSFGSIPNFLAGIPSSGTALTPGSDENREPRFYTFGFYAQDDWRITSRVTLNLGLRYEFATTPYDRLGRNYAFVPDLATAATTTKGAIFTNPTLHNFGPRIGVAWDVFGNGKTSVRTAFGEYYDVGNMGYVFYNQGRGTPPLSSSSTLSSTKEITIPFTFGNPGNQLTTNQYNISQPHMLQWNLSIEQQLSPSLLLSVSYVGTRGIHLWENEEGNPCLPTSVTNGIPSWVSPSGIDCPAPLVNPSNLANGRQNPVWGDANVSSTNADSSFNSLQGVISKRLSHGLEVQGAFTWGRVTDDTQGMVGTAECATLGAEGVYPLNQKEFDRGPACFDIKDNLRVTALYHLPNFGPENPLARGVLRGWWFGSLVSWETGFPFTPMLSTYRSLSDHLSGFNSGGNSTDRASLGTTTVAPGQTGPDGTTNTAKSSTGQTFTFIPYDPKTVITGNPQQWFNPLMFTPGPVGFLGTAGRDILRGPGLSNVDFSINKNTPAHFLGEAGQIQFRAEFFNILNRANFGTPVGTAYAGTPTDIKQFDEAPAGTAGQISNTVTTSRQIQLSLKIMF